MTTMPNGDPHLPNPSAHFPHWDNPDPTAHIHSPPHYDAAAFSALQRFLPSNTADDGGILPAEGEHPDREFDIPADAFSCDHFRMFDFKVKMCARARPHDWTECPFAHLGEKARRRDPRSHRYSSSACPDFRRGVCGKGDACEHAHGVFERWLHPSLYRTQPCKDGTRCRRRICFFAHAPEQLRVLAGSPNRSPQRPEHVPFVVFGSSPTSARFISPTNGSLATFPGEFLKPSLQLSKMKMGTSPLSREIGSGSPRIRPGFMSLTTTTAPAVNRFGPIPFVEPAMERVESGKALREKIYAKLGKDNSLERVDPDRAVPDVGWVWELVK